MEVNICRICLEKEINKECFAADSSSRHYSEMISPCKCKGTSLYVHKKCLEMWQDSVHPDRAIQCPVCTSAITHKTYNLILKKYLGVKTVRFLHSIVYISWLYYSCIFLLPLKTSLQIILYVLSLWLPREGISIDKKNKLIWIGERNSKSLVLLNSAKFVSNINAGDILISAENDSSNSSYMHKGIILITEHKTSLGYKGILINKNINHKNTNKPTTDNYFYKNGGPKGLGEISAFHNDKYFKYGCDNIFKNIYFSKIPEIYLNKSEIEIKKDLALIKKENSNPEDLRLIFFNGHCSWSDLQLEDEINKGYWYILSQKSSDFSNYVNSIVTTIFSNSEENLWNKIFYHFQISDQS